MQLFFHNKQSKAPLETLYIVSCLRTPLIWSNSFQTNNIFCQHERTLSIEKMSFVNVSYAPFFNGPVWLVSQCLFLSPDVSWQARPSWPLHAAATWHLAKFANYDGVSCLFCSWGVCLCKVNSRGYNSWLWQLGSVWRYFLQSGRVVLTAHLDIWEVSLL